jgi:hypothetical protein
MLALPVVINGVAYAAGTAVSALPADHIQRLKTAGMIKETKPKKPVIETK